MSKKNKHSMSFKHHLIILPHKIKEPAVGSCDTKLPARPLKEEGKVNIIHSIGYSRSSTFGISISLPFRDVCQKGQTTTLNVIIGFAS